MMYLVMVVTIVLAAVIQALLPAWNYLGHAKVPVLFAVTLYYALMRNRSVTVFIAICAGLLQDALDMMPMGYSALVFTFLAVLVNLQQKKIMVEQGLTHMVLGVTLSLCMIFLLYLLLISRGDFNMPFSAVLTKGFGTALLGIFVMPGVYMLLHHIDLKLGIINEG